MDNEFYAHNIATIITMASTGHDCSLCGRKNFASKRSLDQHQRQSKSCFAKLKAQLVSKSSFTRAADYLPVKNIIMPQKRPSQYADGAQDDYMLGGLSPKRTKYFVLPGQESRQSNHVVDLDELDDDDFEGFYAHDDDSVTSDAPVVNPVPVGYTSDAIQKSFYRYLQKAGDFAPLTGAQENAINLLLRSGRLKPVSAHMML